MRILDGLAPMAERSPGGERPDLVLTPDSSTQLPRAELALYFCETGHNLVHRRRTLRGVLLDRVPDNQRFDGSKNRGTSDFRQAQNRRPHKTDFGGVRTWLKSSRTGFPG